MTWIIEILLEKWDTIQFVEFEIDSVLANELKFFVLDDSITNYYESN